VLFAQYATLIRINTDLKNEKRRKGLAMSDRSAADAAPQSNGAYGSYGSMGHMVHSDPKYGQKYVHTCAGQLYNLRFYLLSFRRFTHQSNLNDM
jgi:hypothetical protein